MYCFRSNKLKPFWLSITEKETLPVLDFLSAALLSVEYDRALSRALAMAECPVVPFFGAFLRELGEIISAGEGAGDHQPYQPHPQTSGKPPKSGSGGSQTPKGSGHRDQQQQQRQVVGESDFFFNTVYEFSRSCFTLEINFRLRWEVAENCRMFILN